MPMDIPKIPDGLEDLMRGLSKAVLKEKPENIIEFAAKYFESLLIKRDGSLMKNYEIFDSLKKCRRYTKHGGVSKKKKSIKPENLAVTEMKLNTSPILFGDKINEDDDNSNSNDLLSRTKLRKRSSQGLRKNLNSITEETPIENKGMTMDEAAFIIQKVLRKYLIRKRNLEQKVVVSKSAMTVNEAAFIIQKLFRLWIIKKRGVIKAKLLVPKPATEPIVEGEDSKSLLEYLQEEDKARRFEERKLKGIELDCDTGEVLPSKIDVVESDGHDSLENVIIKNDEIDLKDPGLYEAALVIQKIFRGYQTRKDINYKKITDQKQGFQDLDRPEIIDAVIKIQKNFRGYQVRKRSVALKNKGNKINDIIVVPLSEIIESDSADVKQCDDDLPDLNDPEMANAAAKIQKSFRGHKTKKVLKEEKLKSMAVKSDIENDNNDIIVKNDDNLPDLNDPEMADAAMKIQKSFRGHMATKESKKKKQNSVKNVDFINSNKIDKTNNNEIILDDAEVNLCDNDDDDDVEKQKNNKNLLVDASKIDINLLDINNPEFMEKAAAIKIQKLFRGYKVRKELNYNKNKTIRNDENLSELNNLDIAEAVLKIQKIFRGYQVRKNYPKNPSQLLRRVLNPTAPEIDYFIENNEEVQKKLNDSAVKIQKTYRGHRARNDVKEMKLNRSTKNNPEIKNNKEANAQVPLLNLKDEDINNAALKIQKNYRGYTVRKDLKEKNKLKDKKIIENVDKTSNGLLENLSNKFNNAINSNVEKVENLLNGSIKQDIESVVGNDTEMNEAALRIQKTYRGHKVRKNMKESKLTGQNSGGFLNKMSDRNNSVIDSNVEKAQNLLTLNNSDKINNNEIKTAMKEIDSSNPEMNDAALKIQKTYRGHRTRKNLKEKNRQVKEDEGMKLNTLSDTVDNNVEKTENLLNLKNSEVLNAEAINIQEESGDVEMNEAAKKIQKTYRGHKVRKDIKAKKAGLNTSLAIEPAVIGNIAQLENNLESTEKEVYEESEGLLNKISNRINSTMDSNIEKLENLLHLKSSEEKNTTEYENNPENNEAATKIQKTYRGHTVRKDFKNRKFNNSILDTSAVGAAVVADIDQVAHKIESAEHEINEESEGLLNTVSNRINNAVDSNIEIVENLLHLKSSELGDNMVVEGYEHDPELNEAAKKIQKTYRGHVVRKDIKSQKSNNLKIEDVTRGPPDMDDIVNKVESVKNTEESDGLLNRLSNRINSAMDSNVKKIENLLHVNGPKSSDNLVMEGYEHDPELNEAAKKIQKTYRGHVVRKDIKNKKSNNLITATSALCSTVTPNMDEMVTTIESAKNTVVEDSEGLLNKVSNRINSAVDANIENIEKSLHLKGSEPGDTMIVEGYEHDPELNEAAKKIQKTYRGHVVRKDIKSQKSNNSITDTSALGSTVTPNMEEMESLESTEVIESEGLLNRLSNRFNSAMDSNVEKVENLLHVKSPVVSDNLIVEGYEHNPELNEAAKKIQKTYRGHVVRKDIKNKNPNNVILGTSALSSSVTPNLNDVLNNVESIENDVNEESEGLITKISNRINSAIDSNIEKVENLLHLKSSEVENNSIKEGYEHDPELNEAAKKIQKTYRGHMVRKDIKSQKLNNSMLDTSAVGAAVVADIDQVAQKSVNNEIKESEGLFNKISNRINNAVDSNIEKVENLLHISGSADIETRTGAPIKYENDPDMNEAATKIQKTYRGHMVRKDIKNNKINNSVLGATALGAALITNTDDIANKFESVENQAVEESEGFLSKVSNRINRVMDSNIEKVENLLHLNGPQQNEETENVINEKINDVNNFLNMERLNVFKSSVDDVNKLDTIQDQIDSEILEQTNLILDTSSPSRLETALVRDDDEFLNNKDYAENENVSESQGFLNKLSNRINSAMDTNIEKIENLLHASGSDQKDDSEIVISKKINDVNTFLNMERQNVFKRSGDNISNIDSKIEEKTNFYLNTSTSPELTAAIIASTDKLASKVDSAENESVEESEGFFSKISNRINSAMDTNIEKVENLLHLKKSNNEADINMNSSEMNDAAVKIQKTYRGHRVRRNIQENKLNNETLIDEPAEAPVEGVSDFIEFLGMERSLNNPEEIVNCTDLPLVEVKESDVVSKNLNQLSDRINSAVDSKITDFENLLHRKKSIKAADIQNDDENNVKSSEDEIFEKSNGLVNDMQVENGIDLVNPEMNDAALKIQKSYRGHLVRRDIKQKKLNNLTADTARLGTALVMSGIANSTDNSENENNESAFLNKVNQLSNNFNNAVDSSIGKVEGLLNLKENDESQRNDAALKIQKSYRGYRVRSDLKEQKLNKKKFIESETAIDEVESKIATENKVEEEVTKKSGGLLNKMNEFSDGLNSAMDSNIEKVENLLNLKYSEEDEIGITERIDDLNKFLYMERSYITSEMEGDQKDKILNSEFVNESMIEKTANAIESTENSGGIFSKMSKYINSTVDSNIEKVENLFSSNKSENKKDNIPSFEELNTPEMNDAALKIQKSYRGYRVRRDLTDQKLNNKPNESIKIDDNIDAINDNVNTKSNGFLNKLSENINSAVDSNIEKVTNLFHVNNTSEIKNNDNKNLLNENKIDFDLENPEMNDAALKIQKTYRGHQARKDFKAKKLNNQSVGKINTTEDKIIKVSNDFSNESSRVNSNVDSSINNNANLLDLNASEEKWDNDKININTEEKSEGFLSKLSNRINSTMDSNIEKIENLLHLTTKEGNSDGGKLADVEQDVIVSKKLDENENDLKYDELNDAALKIQKNYRGYKVRKNINDNKLSTTKDVISDNLEGVEEEMVNNSGGLLNKVSDQINSTVDSNIERFENLLTFNKSELTDSTELNEIIDKKVKKSISEALNEAQSNIESAENEVMKESTSLWSETNNHAEQVHSAVESNITRVENVISFNESKIEESIEMNKINRTKVEKTTSETIHKTHSYMETVEHEIINESEEVMDKMNRLSKSLNSAVDSNIEKVENLLHINNFTATENLKAEPIVDDSNSRNSEMNSSVEESSLIEGALPLKSNSEMNSSVEESSLIDRALPLTSSSEMNSSVEESSLIDRALPITSNSEMNSSVEESSLIDGILPVIRNSTRNLQSSKKSSVISSKTNQVSKNLSSSIESKVGKIDKSVHSNISKGRKMIRNNSESKEKLITSKVENSEISSEETSTKNKKLSRGTNVKYTRKDTKSKIPIVEKASENKYKGVATNKVEEIAKNKETARLTSNKDELSRKKETVRKKTVKRSGTLLNKIPDGATKSIDLTVGKVEKILHKNSSKPKDDLEKSIDIVVVPGLENEAVEKITETVEENTSDGILIKLNQMSDQINNVVDANIEKVENLLHKNSSEAKENIDDKIHEIQKTSAVVLSEMPDGINNAVETNIEKFENLLQKNNSDAPENIEKSIIALNISEVESDIRNENVQDKVEQNSGGILRAISDRINSAVESNIEKVENLFQKNSSDAQVKIEESISSINVSGLENHNPDDQENVDDAVEKTSGGILSKLSNRINSTVDSNIEKVENLFHSNISEAKQEIEKPIIEPALDSAKEQQNVVDNVKEASGGILGKLNQISEQINSAVESSVEKVENLIHKNSSEVKMNIEQSIDGVTVPDFEKKVIETQENIENEIDKTSGGILNKMNQISNHINSAVELNIGDVEKIVHKNSSETKDDIENSIDGVIVQGIENTIRLQDNVEDKIENTSDGILNKLNQMSNRINSAVDSKVDKVENLLHLNRTDDNNEGEILKQSVDTVLRSPEQMNDAALKIQKSYRGYKVRNDIKAKQSIGLDNSIAIDEVVEGEEKKSESSIISKMNQLSDRINSVVDSNVEKVENLFKSSEEVHEANINSNEINDINSENEAALKIQKTYRGHKVRKNLNENYPSRIPRLIKQPEIVKEQSSGILGKISDSINNVVDTNIENVDNLLNLSNKNVSNDITNLDSEMNNAAIKIQKTYRGHKVRKDIRENNSKLKDLPTSAISIENAKNNDELIDKNLARSAKSKVNEMKLNSAKIADVNTEEMKQNIEETSEKSTGFFSKLNKLSNRINSAVDSNIAKVENLLHLKSSDSKTVAENEPINDNEQNDAAIKIQKTYRGHKARKEVRDMKLNNPNVVSSLGQNINNIVLNRDDADENVFECENEEIENEINHEISDSTATTVTSTTSHTIMSKMTKVSEFVNKTVDTSVEKVENIFSVDKNENFKDDDQNKLEGVLNQLKNLPNVNYLADPDGDESSDDVVFGSLTDIRDINAQQKDIEDIVIKSAVKENEKSVNLSKPDDLNEDILNMSKNNTKALVDDDSNLNESDELKKIKINNYVKSEKPTVKISDIDSSLEDNQKILLNEILLSQSTLNAIINIQKVFRGYRARKQVEKLKLDKSKNSMFDMFEEDPKLVDSLEPIIDDKSNDKIEADSLDNFNMETKDESDSVEEIIIRKYSSKLTRLLSENSKSFEEIKQEEMEKEEEFIHRVEIIEAITEIEESLMEQQTTTMDEHKEKVVEKSSSSEVLRSMIVTSANEGSGEEEGENEVDYIVEEETEEDEVVTQKSKPIEIVHPDATTTTIIDELEDNIEDTSIPGMTELEMAEIERIDISKFDKDSIEAMYYSLRKNEILLDKMHNRRESNPQQTEIEVSISSKNRKLEKSDSSESDDVVIVMDADLNPLSVSYKLKRMESDSDDVVIRQLTLDFDELNDGNNINNTSNVSQQPSNRSTDDDADVELIREVLFFEDGKKIDTQNNSHVLMQHSIVLDNEEAMIRAVNGEKLYSSRSGFKEREPGDGASEPSELNENYDDDKRFEIFSLDEEANRNNIFHSRESSSMDNPMYYAQKKIEQFLNQIHGHTIEESTETIERTEIRTYNMTSSFVDEGHETTEEDDILEDMVGSSYGDGKKFLPTGVSEADSDYFEPSNKMKVVKDDFNISTALESYGSTDSESTIISAATKIQAGARGFLTRRRLQSMGKNTVSLTERRPSFGNAAIDQSLDDMIEENETAIDRLLRERQKFHDLGETTMRESTMMMSTDEPEIFGITEIKLEQKQSTSNTSHSIAINKSTSDSGNESTNSSVEHPIIKSFEANQANLSDLNESNNQTIIIKTEENTKSIAQRKGMSLHLDEMHSAAERRMTLQRGIAVQQSSTPEDEDSNKYLFPIDEDNGTKSFEETLKKSISSNSLPDVGKPIPRRHPSIMRQRTMPVQIETEFMRALPKHLRKRIKSANLPSKKKF